MRYFLFFFPVILSLNLTGQYLVEMIISNDYPGVKNYTGAVNLRDTNQATPLMWSAYCSDLKMVKLLVKKGADASLKGWIYFRDTSSNLDYIYGSCLAITAGENKSKVLKYFLRKHEIPVDDREILLNGYEENGWTALHWASVKGNKHPAKILIKRGANVNAVSETDMDKTPLLFALGSGQIEMAKILIKRGADVNKPDKNGVAPLSYALETRNRDLIRYMIKHGAMLEEYAKKPLEEMLMELFGVKEIEDI